jgi:hypothetical protein
MALRTGCAGQTVERIRNWRNIKQPEEIRKIFPPDQEDRAGGGIFLVAFAWRLTALPTGEG